MKLTYLAAFLPLVLLHGDTLYLRDGRTIEGTFISGNSRQIRFLPDGGRTLTFAITSVERMSFGEEPEAATRPALGGARPQSGSATRTRTEERTIPAGTVVTLRLIDPINSDQNSAGESFRASLDEPLVVNGQTIAPAGADATVQVVRVDQSGTISGREEIALVLSEIRAHGRTLKPETNHAEVAAKSRSRESAKVIGGTAVVGAIIGAIAGGGKGAAIGAASGAGAGVAIQAIRGQRIQVPSETRLDFTLAQPLRY